MMQVASGNKSRLEASQASEYFPDEMGYQQRVRRSVENSLSLQVCGGWDSIEGLPHDRVDTWLIPLHPCPINALVPVVYSVSFDQDNCKVRHLVVSARDVFA